MKHKLTPLLLSRALDDDLDVEERFDLAEALRQDPAMAGYFQELQSLGPLLRSEFPPVTPPLSATLAAMRLAMPSPTSPLIGTGALWLAARSSSAMRIGMVRGHSSSDLGKRRAVGRRRLILKTI